VPPPSIASFGPTDGPVGGEVTQTGAGFSGATAVEFNGTPAASYIVDSDAQIRATVPPAATTGRIVVTTPAGSGLSGSDFTVILSPTTTVLQSSANPSTWGAQVVLEATVAPAAATGTVRFFDGVTPLGTAPVSGGLATLSVNTLAVGQHELTASYDGGAWYAGSSSAPWSQAVDFASTTAVLDAQPAETHCAEAVTLSAAVSPATATGTVQFCDGLNPIGPPQPVSDGVATLSWTDLPAGTHTLIAKYSGDGRYGPSQSDAIPHDVIAS